MRKNLLLISSIFLVVAFTCYVNAQPIFQESFDYPAGDTLTNHGWDNHSGSGFFITLTNGGLTYPGLPSNGNAVDVTMGGASREDVHVDLSQATTTGSIYASFLVRVDSASNTGIYFFHFSDSVAPGAVFRAKVFARDTSVSGPEGAGNIQFGVSKASSTSTIEWTTATYDYNIVYLLVLKYEVVGDVSGSDDIVSLFIDPDVTQPEPGVPDITNIDSGGDIPIESIVLRQGFVSGPEASIRVDEIVVGPNWFDVLPVELSSFSASVTGSTVTLNWATATELNNSGFDILRLAENEQWSKIAFVEGYGTTSETRNYSFADNNLPAGQYSYRLKQIDFDGSSVLSDLVNVEVINPAEYALSQNYPNPFNPVTLIKYSLPVKSQVELVVYNTLGESVMQLVNEEKPAGTYEVDFNAAELPSGIYFYKLQAGSFVETKKMVLMK